MPDRPSVVSQPFVAVSVIKLLERKLADAKSGKLRAVAIASAYHGASAVNHAWAADRGGCVVTLLGAVYRLAHMLQADLDTVGETVDDDE